MGVHGGRTSQAPCLGEAVGHAAADGLDAVKLGVRPDVEHLVAARLRPGGDDAAKQVHLSGAHKAEHCVAGVTAFPPTPHLGSCGAGGSARTSAWEPQACFSTTLVRPPLPSTTSTLSLMSGRPQRTTQLSAAERPCKQATMSRCPPRAAGRTKL